MKPISEALRELLDDRSLSDTQLMAAADVSPATVSQYLSGRRGRRMNSQALKTVEKLAAALDVDPEYFLEYRQAKAERLVREAIGKGWMDLDDIELIIARHEVMEGLETHRAMNHASDEDLNG
jgi:transcriptional regulator with XRE-family HTH domain